MDLNGENWKGIDYFILSQFVGKGEKLFDEIEMPRRNIAEKLFPKSSMFEVRCLLYTYELLGFIESVKYEDLDYENSFYYRFKITGKGNSGVYENRFLEEKESDFDLIPSYSS